MAAYRTNRTTCGVVTLRCQELILLFVGRGSWGVVRGSWVVVRGSWGVVRGSWGVTCRAALHPVVQHQARNALELAHVVADKLIKIRACRTILSYPSRYSILVNE